MYNIALLARVGLNSKGGTMIAHKLSKNNGMRLSQLLFFIFSALGSAMLSAVEEDPMEIDEPVADVSKQLKQATINRQLMYAVRKSSINEVQKLLSQGGNPDFRPMQEVSSLMEIALAKDDTDIAQVLLNNGARWELVRKWKKDEGISLDQYAHSIQWAVEHGWNYSEPRKCTTDSSFVPPHEEIREVVDKDL
jgi:hypothetical protein